MFCNVEGFANCVQLMTGVPNLSSLVFTNMCVVLTMLNRMFLGVVVIPLFIFFIVCIWVTFKYLSNKAKKKNTIKVINWAYEYLPEFPDIFICVLNKFYNPKNLLYKFSMIKYKEKYKIRKN